MDDNEGGDPNDQFHRNVNGSSGGTVLFVGDLHWWTTDAELESELCKYGHVKEVKFFVEKASGKSKGYCQVEFYDPSAAIACKEGMNGHVFNGRPCVVAFASPDSGKTMGEAQVNRNQQMAHSSAAQAKRDLGPGRRGMAGRGPGGRGGMGGRCMMGNGFGPLPMMHPQSMMGQGFDPSFGGPTGRVGSYGGFASAPTPPFASMLPSFPPVPGLTPHVNSSFFGSGMPMNGMGMMPTSGADWSNTGIWSDTNMPGWAGDDPMDLMRSGKEDVEVLVRNQIKCDLKYDECDKMYNAAVASIINLKLWDGEPGPAETRIVSKYLL